MLNPAKNVSYLFSNFGIFLHGRLFPTNLSVPARSLIRGWLFLLASTFLHINYELNKLIYKLVCSHFSQTFSFLLSASLRDWSVVRRRQKIPPLDIRRILHRKPLVKLNSCLVFVLFSGFILFYFFVYFWFGNQHAIILSKFVHCQFICIRIMNVLIQNAFSWEIVYRFFYHGESRASDRRRKFYKRPLSDRNLQTKSRITFGRLRRSRPMSVFVISLDVDFLLLNVFWHPA